MVRGGNMRFAKQAERVPYSKYNHSFRSHCGIVSRYYNPFQEKPAQPCIKQKHA